MIDTNLSIYFGLFHWPSNRPFSGRYTGVRRHRLDLSGSALAGKRFDEHTHNVAAFKNDAWRQ